MCRPGRDFDLQEIGENVNKKSKTPKTPKNPPRMAHWNYSKKELVKLTRKSYEGLANRDLVVTLYLPRPVDPDLTDTDQYQPFLSIGVHYGSNTPEIYFEDRETLKELADLLMKAYHEIPDTLEALQYKNAVKEG